MTRPVPVKKTDSVLEELNHLRERITKRAYEIFEARGQIIGNEVDHWLQAEAELIWRPGIDMQEKENEFHLRAATPGVDPKDIKIEVTAEEVLIKAECGHEHHSGNSELHVCEFTAANLFRAIRFPKRIDPDTVKAEFKDGILSLTAGIAKETQPREVKLKIKDASSGA